MDTFLFAYKTYVIPILEYCSPVWSPHLLCDIDKVEAVQRYFTRRLFARFGLGNQSYLERLEHTRLQSLELRRLHQDLVICYKIVHKDVDLDFRNFFSFAPDSRTRGHSLKLFLPGCRTVSRKSFFTHRIVPIWNALPDSSDDMPVIIARNSQSFDMTILR